MLVTYRSRFGPCQHGSLMPNAATMVWAIALLTVVMIGLAI